MCPDTHSRRTLRPSRAAQRFLVTGNVTAPAGGGVTTIQRRAFVR
jgi:hypothetical protein